MSYYFIGNGSATIGGGSMGRTEQVPSLKLLCLDLCSRHLDQLNNLGDMPTEMFIDLLNRAKTKATPEVVQRLQDINERLLCEDVDVAYWKRAVDEHILRRMIPAPGPVLVERVNDYKERLVELIAETPETPSKEWSLEVNYILKELGEIPASVGLLRETMIGKAVGPLRKTSDAQIASLSADIIRRWKEAARNNGPEQQKCSAATAAASSSTPSKAGGSAGVSEDKQRAVEEGFNCRTWNSLYKYLELLREDKVRASSKRAREARERELQKKPRMIVGKSKGEGFVIQRSGRRSGKAPPIEIPVSHVSSLMKTPTSKGGSSSGGGSSNSGIKTGGIRTSGIRTSGIKTSGIMTNGKNKRSTIGSTGSSSNKTKSGSSSSSSSSRSSSSSSSSSRSSSSSSKSKGGVATLAEIRRKIANDQRLSTAFKGDRPGPSKGERSPGKRSKFWQ